MRPAQLVTMTEIAELADVRRPTVSNWRRRHAGFPRPVRDDGGLPLFDADDITAWLDDRPIPDPPDNRSFRTYGERFRDRLRLRALASLRGSVPGDHLLAGGLALAALRHITGHPLTDVRSAREAARQVERSQPELAGVLTADIDELPDEAAALVWTIEEMCAVAGAASAVEQLIAGADRLGSGLRVQTTPEAIAEIVGAAAGAAAANVVYDPAAGCGTLLLRVLGEGSEARVVAADLDGATVRLLRQRMICHGRPVELSQRDSLHDPVSVAADLVVVDPPFTASDVRADAPELRGEGNPYMWARLATDHLTDTGRAFVLIPTWALARRQGMRSPDDPIASDRARLLDSGCLRAVVKLPRRAHPFRTGTELALLALTRPRKDRPRQVLMCDADRLPAGDLPGQLGRLINAWLSADSVEASPDVAAPVPVSRSRDRGTLLPLQMLSPDPSPVDHSRALFEASRRLGALMSPGELDLPNVGSPTVRPRYVSVHEYLVNGRLSLLAGHRIAPEHIGDSGYRVLGAAELRGESSLGRRRIDQLALASYEMARLTEPGDVVVLPTAPLRVLVDTEGGGVAVSPAQVLRISPPREPRGQGRLWMTPHVLAALLGTPRNADRFAGALVRRVDVSALELPELSVEEVGRLDAILRRLTAQRERTAERLTALDDLIGALVAGVADGVFLVAEESPAREYLEGDTQGEETRGTTEYTTD